MIPTLLRISATSLSRDRVAQAMVFLLPISFFSFFALVFGNMHNGTGRVHVAVVDQDHSDSSRRLIAALAREKGLRVETASRPDGAAKNAPEVPLDEARAQAMVRNGDVPVAIVVPAGFDTTFMRFGNEAEPLRLLTDPSDAIAPQIVGGLLQKVAMTAAPDRFAKSGIDEFEHYMGRLTPAQREAVDGWIPRIRSKASADSGMASSGVPQADSTDALSGILRVKVTEVLGEKKDNGMVSFYAAGIAVMFLLFSCSAGAGVLLDELDSGTLDRVLTTRVGMNGLLLGKWTWLTLLGMLQILVMFLWAMVVFKLDFLHHLPGFAVMAFFTAATAATFGLVLATACRTRQQLGGISTIVILMMSGLGGSMFPRIFMSDGMQKLGLLTFNAWALDGFVKVFWRNASLAELLPQVGVLSAFALAFATVARLQARRWEAG
jgi:ABC-2 type transport system permease protein